MTGLYHSGEIEVQEQTGERDRAILNARALSGRLPTGARAFISRQIHCALGGASGRGDIWSCFAVGAPGFAEADEAGAKLRIDLGAGGGFRSIPPLEGVRVDDALAALFIEFSTRRRLRVNGILAEAAGSGLLIDIAEAFANCPKYIQRRELDTPTANPEPAATSIRRGQGLGAELRAWLTGADMFFVASAHPDGPVDVSHRGGRPGFVKVKADELLIPDYPGNSMFCTLGNFALNPRAGLTFLDFDRARQLQLTGDVRLDLEAGECAGETGGSGRWWAFSPRKWIISTLGPSFHWKLMEGSPFNP
jgi:uncharacterized protein